MDFGITWANRATDDLQSIIDYIAQDNPTAAVRVISDIIQRVRMLATTPHMGKRFARIPEIEIREIISGKYRVFYRVHEGEDRLEILTIWHSARGDPDLSFN